MRCGCLQFESDCWWNWKISSASAGVCVCVCGWVRWEVFDVYALCGMQLTIVIIIIIIMGVATALLIYLGWCARLYFGFIPTELWHHWRRRLTHPLISPAPVPRRPPDSSDQQCSSPDHRCDCPCHRYVWLSDPTWSGTYPARSAKDFVPDKEKTGRAGNWGVGRCGVCMLFLLLYCVLGSWQKWKTHINRQLLHILWIHITVQRVVLIQITVHFVAHISHLSVCFPLFSCIKVQNLLFFSFVLLLLLFASAAAAGLVLFDRNLYRICLVVIHYSCRQ